MMNMFSRKELSSQMNFHNMTMHKNFLSINLNERILFFLFSTIFRIARFGTKPFLPNSRRRYFKIFPTLNAFHFFLCAIMSRLPRNFFNSFRLSFMFCEMPLTLSRTTYCCGRAIGLNQKNFITYFTSNRDSHAIIQG